VQRDDRRVPDPAREPTVTVDRAAAVLGIGRSAAYDAVRRGEIPALRFGRRLVVPSAALVALLSSTKTKEQSNASTCS
jgi:excisionase family DNA binding protein